MIEIERYFMLLIRRVTFVFNIINIQKQLFERKYFVTKLINYKNPVLSTQHFLGESLRKKRCFFTEIILSESIIMEKISWYYNIYTTFRLRHLFWTQHHKKIQSVQTSWFFGRGPYQLYIFLCLLAVAFIHYTVHT